MASTNQATGTGGFHSFAGSASHVVGSRWAFTLVTLGIVFWALSGPYFHYSDTWQLVVNTATTVITFLIVFLIQNTQNRDARAIHLKLDEIIHAIGRERNEMIQIENLSDGELDELTAKFDHFRAEGQRRRSGKKLGGGNPAE